MTRAAIFWTLMLLWLLSGLGVIFMLNPPLYIRYSHDLLLFILIGLLGWQVYGAAIKG